MKSKLNSFPSINQANQVSAASLQESEELIHLSSVRTGVHFQSDFTYCPKLLPPHQWGRAGRYELVYSEIEGDGQWPGAAGSKKHGARMTLSQRGGKCPTCSERGGSVGTECVTSSKPLVARHRNQHVVLCPFTSSPQKVCPFLTDYFKIVWFLNYLKYLGRLGKSLDLPLPGLLCK